ncbi:MAG TPA: DUF6132 family protein [Prolixibacteraceae bacterium]|nr:DUF6132 family protein [Prolixibacteraceae bacterium]
MKEFIVKHKWALIAGVAGGIGGFLYWRFVGCTSGTCPIKSVWYWSTLWGAAMGYLLGDMVNDWFVRRKLKKNSQSADSEENPSL